MLYVLNENNKHVRQPYGMAVMRMDGKILTVNEVGGGILSLLSTAKQQDELIGAVASLYEVESDVLCEDVEDFLNFSIKNDIVKTYPSTAQPEVHLMGSSEATSVIQADIELTYNCAYMCSYCYVDKRDKTILRYDDWEKIINNLVKKGVMQVSLTGGDPLLHPDFPQIIQLLNRHKLKVQVFTTGHKIPQRNLDALLRSELNFVHVSLDSLDKTRNDAHRISKDGSSATENTLNFIRLLKDHKIKIAMGVLVKPDQMEKDLHEISKFAIENKITARFSGIVKRGIEESITYDSEILPPPAYSELNKITEQYDSENEYLEFEPVGCTDNKLPCKFNLGFIAIGPTGFVRPCLESETFFKQHIPEQMSEKIDVFSFEYLEETSFFQHLSAIDPQNMPDPDGWCSGCEKISACLGCILAGNRCKSITLNQ